MSARFEENVERQEKKNTWSLGITEYIYICTKIYIHINNIYNMFGMQCGIEFIEFFCFYIEFLNTHVHFRLGVYVATAIAFKWKSINAFKRQTSKQ